MEILSRLGAGGKTEKALGQLLAVIFCLLGLLFISPSASAADTQTALDRYVAKPDPAYAYKLVDAVKGGGATAFIIEMTSQTWLTTNEVDRPVWKHWLTIVKPDTAGTSTGFLSIGGGGNDRSAPKGPDLNLVRLAVETKSVITELRMVPNQPLTFAGESKGRSEDSLIAYTWDKYLRTGDEKWPARLPMTKSAVRAMDTVTAFCASPGRTRRSTRSCPADGADH